MPELFGAVDRNRVSKAIQSEYPAWYFETHIAEMKEGIERKKRELERGIVPQSEVPYMKASLEKEEIRLQEINDSKPKVTEKEKDNFAKARRHLAKEIRDSMFTRTDMLKGLASPHEEAIRMVDPIIKISKEVADLAESCGVDLNKSCNGKKRNGNISRNEASRIFKIIGKFLGEPTNVETLRKDRTTVRSY